MAKERRILPFQLARLRIPVKQSTSYLMNQHAIDLIEQWSSHLSVSPFLLLDGTWPSLAVVDALTFGLRAEEDFPPSLDPIIRGGSAYLAELAASCWRSFCTDVEILDTSNGIELRGQGGPLLNNAVISFLVEAELRRMLLEVPTSFELFHDAAVPIQVDSNFLAPFTLGIATALSPSVKGLEYDDASLEAPWIDVVQKELASQCAASYQRLFPDEALGQMAEIYLGSFVCPPPFVGEALPLLRAVEQFCELCAEYKFDLKLIEHFASCLARSPDEHSSSFGLVIFAAISSSRPSAELIAVAQRKGTFVGLLRIAMLSARRILLGREDWLETGLESDEQLSHFKSEAILGFIPWVQFSSSALREPEYFKSVVGVIRNAIDFDISSGIESCDKILETTPSDLSLRIQRARFDIIQGDFERANRMFADLLSEPGITQDTDFHNLWGLVRLELGQLKEARSSFTRATRCAEGDLDYVAELNNNLAWCAMLEQEFDEAARFLDLSIADAHCPLTALLNRIMVSWKLGEYQQVPILRERLFELSPFDRRVFANLTLSAETIEQLLH